MKQIPFVKENLKPTRTKTIERSKVDLKPNESLTLCVEARNYDQHCLNDNTSDQNIQSLIYAYIKETGEHWTIEYYPGEMTEQQLHDGMMNILNTPHKYNNQQPHHNKN